MKKSVVWLLLLSLIMLLPATAFSAVGLPIAYEWNSLPIGAGGFVTGLVIHPTEPNLVYIRTDVGGAYRWNEENKDWTQLFDSFGRQQSSFYGIDGIALDPHNPDVVYVASGGNMGEGSDVLKSYDRGATWNRTNLTAALKAAYPSVSCGFSGNGANRGMGERICVDPANGNIVYVGTINGGLWKTINGGQSWTQVTLPNLPLPSTVDEGGTSVLKEVRSIFYDTTTSVEGVKTNTIYVGVTNLGLYRSMDGGETWALLSGSPKTPMRMSAAPSKGILYVASMTGLFEFKNNTWREISPAASRGLRFNAVSVDPLNENALVCSGPHTGSNYMTIPIQYSPDGGTTWINKTNTSVRQSTLPWNPTPGFNSNGHVVVMDWNKAGRTWFADWFCAWRTEDIVSGATQTWTYYYKNIEEMVPRDIISQPTGENRLVLAVADNKGFPYTDPSQYPTKTIGAPANMNPSVLEVGLMSTSDLDFCYSDPKYIVGVGMNWNTYGKLEISTDNAKSWTSIKNVPCYVDKNGNILKDEQNADQRIPYGKVAMSSQKHPTTGKPVIVSIPAYDPDDSKYLPSGVHTLPRVTNDLGATWAESQGLGAINITRNHWDGSVPITSDKVVGQNFYILCDQQVYVSTDWGANFTPTEKIDPTCYNRTTMKIKAAPNMAGEVWATMGHRLYRSSNGAQSFNVITGISNVVGFGFGKEAPGKTNPTVFLYGTINGTEGIYRSTDMGATWLQINDNNHKFGCSPGIVEGDMQQFGMVYLGSGGRGVFYGNPDPNGSVPDEWKDVPNQQYSKTLTNAADITDWSFYIYDYSFRKTDKNGFETTASGLKNGTWAYTHHCLYDGLTWTGNYTARVTVKGEGAGASNTAIVLFNYVDKDNYYYITFGGQNDSRDGKYPIILGRRVGGTETALDTYQNSTAPNGGNTIELTYRFGKMTVALETAGVLNTILTGEDFELSSGKIGVGCAYNAASFKNLSIVQQPYSVTPLLVADCSLVNSLGNDVVSLQGVAGQEITVLAKAKRVSANCGDSVYLVVGLFDEYNTLQQAWTSIQPLPESGVGDVVMPFTVPDDATNTHTIQCYFWDGVGQMQPLANAQYFSF